MPRDAWNRCVIEGLRVDVGMGTARSKKPVVVLARIGGRWHEVLGLSVLELIVAARSEITAAGIKARVRRNHQAAARRGRP